MKLNTKMGIPEGAKPPEGIKMLGLSVIPRGPLKADYEESVSPAVLQVTDSSSTYGGCRNDKRVSISPLMNWGLI